MATHGITLVFPSAGFNSRANLQAIQDEKYSQTIGLAPLAAKTSNSEMAFFDGVFRIGFLEGIGIHACFPSKV